MLQYDSDASRESQSGEEAEKDEQLRALAETAAEFLADICVHIQKVKPNGGNVNFIEYLIARLFLQETVADLVREGYLTERTRVAAARSLTPNFQTSVRAFLARELFSQEFLAFSPLMKA